MHLRRALLLFAIVLGMAALAAGLSRPLEGRRVDQRPAQPTSPGPATVEPQPAPDIASEPISFDTVKDESRRMRAGEAATLEVSVPAAGSVEIPGLGLTSAADPFTPARFDVYPTKAGRYPLLFIPAGGGTEAPAGRLVVRSAG